ncbi:MAG: hypothetical protein OEV94_09160 [Deltaproteobacteria bacterium]|nr:hypothetical protein [Deltaproteobacteria bacterium]
MNLGFVFRVLFSLALFFGGLLWVFPLEVVGWSAAALALATGWAVVFRRSLRVVVKPPPGLNPALAQLLRAARAKAQAKESSPAAAQVLSTPLSRLPAEPAEPGQIPSGVFGGFQQHLNALEGKPAAPAAKSRVSGKPARSPVPPAEEDEPTVEISKAGRKLAEKKPREARMGGYPAPGTPIHPAGAPPKTAASPGAANRANLEAPQPQPTSVESKESNLGEPLLPPGQDLFSDLRPSLDEVSAAKPAAKSGRLDPARPEKIRQALGTGAGPAAEDAAALLDAFDRAVLRRDAQAARESYEKFESLAAKDALLGRGALGRRGEEARVRLAVTEGDPSEAAAMLETLLEDWPAPEPAELEELMGRLTEGADPAQRPALRVNLLLKVLAIHRKSANQGAMDQVYGLIVGAQEQAGDPKRLVQFLKNQLALKKALGDTQGQTALADRLGKELFRLGDNEGAKEYYEMAIGLKEK